VLCIGQPIGAILAENREVARKATYLVKVEYEDLKPILTIEVLSVVLKKIIYFNVVSFFFTFTTLKS
jgi:xanthine dehydrogenase molybdopterin-binding subunit B